jgi:NAD+ diphosphatase
MSLFAAVARETPTFFSQSPLDRLHTLRSRSDGFATAMQLSLAHGQEVLPFVNEKCLVTRAAPTTLVTLNFDELCQRMQVATIDGLHPELILLGQSVRTNKLVWTLDVGARLAPGDSERLMDVRFVARELFHAPEAAAVLCHARALAGWHQKHPFCSKCGQPTAIAEIGVKRVCGACKGEHFPRTDPVAIALVLHRATDSVLLGRQKIWPAGRYSCVAGFVDSGESLEQAVMREVHEETGVRVHRVRFLTSQPWPNYSQLMLGCIAEAESRDINRNDDELEDARWFSRAEIAVAAAKPDTSFMDASDGSLMLPGKYAIARDLIEHWLGTTQEK